MSDEMTPDPQSAAQADLKRLAVLLREAEHLDAPTQRSLASLLEELSEELNSAGPASTKTARLTEAVSEVARALHKQDSAKEFDTARETLKEAAARAEVEAPVATGIVYRFIDLLASIGI